MPIIVDSDERCARISEVASDLIARSGLPSATIRAIANEAGYSTSYITDFFADKRAIMLRVLSDCASRATSRISIVLKQNPLDLYGFAEAYLPLDDSIIRDWKIYFAFWEMASSDAEFSEVQRSWQEVARKSFATILRRRDATLSEKDVTHLAGKLLTLVLGISIQAVFDRSVWTPEHMRSFLQREFAEAGLTNK